MNFELEKNIKYTRAVIFQSVMAILTGFCSVILFHTGILFLPATAGFLAGVFLLEKGKKRIFSFVLPLILIIAEFAFRGIYSLNCIAGITVAVVIYLAFTQRKLTKAEYAGILTAFLSFFIGLTMMLIAFQENGNFSITEAFAFYSNIISELKEQFVNGFIEQMQTNNVFDLSRETVEMMFDTVINSTIAVVVIFAFFLVGCSFKIFSLIAFRYIENKDNVMLWRFITSSVIAYFYIALIILNLFTRASSNIFEISVNNLYQIFSFVFAYLGFVVAVALLTPKIHRVGAIAIVTLAILLFSNFAIQILSVLAVFFTIITNKMTFVNGGKSDDKNNHITK